MASYKLATVLCLFFSCFTVKEVSAGEETPCNTDSVTKNRIRDVYLFCFGTDNEKLPCPANVDSTLIHQFELDNNDIHHVSNANCTFYFKDYENSTYETPVKNLFSEEILSGKDISNKTELYFKMWVFGDPLEDKNISDGTPGKLICVINGYKQEDEGGDVEQLCISSPIYFGYRKKEEDKPKEEDEPKEENKPKEDAVPGK